VEKEIAFGPANERWFACSRADPKAVPEVMDSSGKGISFRRARSADSRPAREADCYLRSGRSRFQIVSSISGCASTLMDAVGEEELTLVGEALEEERYERRALAPGHFANAASKSPVYLAP